jgi:hypothetical protein
MPSFNDIISLGSTRFHRKLESLVQEANIASLAGTSFYSYANKLIDNADARIQRDAISNEKLVESHQSVPDSDVMFSQQITDMQEATQTCRNASIFILRYSEAAFNVVHLLAKYYREHKKPRMLSQDVYNELKDSSRSLESTLIRFRLLVTSLMGSNSVRSMAEDYHSSLAQLFVIVQRTGEIARWMQSALPRFSDYSMPKSESLAMLKSLAKNLTKEEANLRSELLVFTDI